MIPPFRSRVGIWLLAGAVFLIVAASVTLAARGEWQQDRAELRLQTALLADEIALHVAHDFQHRLALLQAFADAWPTGELRNRASFEARARRIVDRTEGFQAISWIDNDYVIRVVVPRERNLGAEDASLAANPQLFRVAQRAVDTGRPQVTKSTSLFQGGGGLVVYIPLQYAGRADGLLNGVFGVETLLAASLRNLKSAQSADSQYQYVIEHEGAVLYARGDPATVAAAPYAVSRPIELPDQQWTVTVAPTPARVGQLISWLDRYGLPLGLLLAFGFATALGLYLERQRAFERNVERLAERERQLATLMDNIPGLVYRCRNDPEWTMEFLSNGCLDLTGYPPSDLLENRVRSYSDVIHPEDRERIWQKVQAALAAKQSFQLIYRLRTAAGEEKWVWEQGRGVYARDGTLRWLEGVVEDVTEHHRAEEALRESEQRYLGILEQASFGVAIHREGRIVFHNPAAEALTGYSATELASLTVDELLSEESRRRVAAIRRARASGKSAPDRYEVDLMPKGREPFPVELTVTSIDYHGEPARMVTLIDLTERRRAERELREAHARLRFHIEQMPLGYVSLDPRGGVTDWNPAAERIFGFSADEAVGRNVFDLVVPPDERGRLEELGQDFTAGRQSVHVTNDNLRSDGRRITCRWINTPLRDSSGRLSGIASFVEDISEQRRVEAERAQLAAVVQQAEAGICITDPNGIITYANPAFARLSGYPADEILGEEVGNFAADDRAPSYREAWSAVQRGQVWRGRLANRRRDGTTYTVDAVLSPIRNHEGRITEFVWSQTDMTEQIKLEAQFQQAQKMEAVGTLAGGIAHDFNNLLTGILGGTQLTLHDLPPDSHLREWLREVQEAAERAAELTQQLLSLSRRQHPNIRATDVNQVVTKTVRLLQRSIPESIHIEADLDDTLPVLAADGGQLTHALLNLGINARDAMPDGGRLVFRTRAIALSPEEAAQYAGGRPGQFALIEVLDTGEGMPPEVLARIFEPFFTTKEVGKGTGLGLAMVYGCANAHNGWITVYSEVGRGTTFHLYLPATPPTHAREEEEEGAAWSPGTETLLLVDDMEVVLTVGKSVLERCGYTVHTASDGEEAARLMSSDLGSRVALVITDLVMPECGGRDLLRQLRAGGVTVPVIVTSGYASAHNPEDLIHEGFAAFIPKPFQARDLAETVRAVLDRSAAAAD